MKIRDVMSRDIETISPDGTLHEAAKKMHRRDCGCVVVMEDRRIVGMITDRDIAIRCVAQSHDPAETVAKDVMSSDILYCFDTDDADDVTRRMGVDKVRRLPVINSENNLVGIVSLGDLASHSNHYLCGKTLGDICRAS